MCDKRSGATLFAEREKEREREMIGVRKPEISESLESPVASPRASLLEKHLAREIFDEIKTRKSKLGLESFRRDTIEPRSIGRSCYKVCQDGGQLSHFHVLGEKQLQYCRGGFLLFFFLLVFFFFIGTLLSIQRGACLV